MIFIIDDNAAMARCIARACKGFKSKIYSNAIAAIDATNDKLPKLIFLDILLDGPDGFTLLNELASYPDTCKIPIVIVSSLDLKESDLSSYNVVGILSKDSMTPSDILSYAEEYGS